MTTFLSNPDALASALAAAAELAKVQQASSHGTASQHSHSQRESSSSRNANDTWSPSHDPSYCSTMETKRRKVSHVEEVANSMMLSSTPSSDSRREDDAPAVDDDGNNAAASASSHHSEDEVDEDDEDEDPHNHTNLSSMDRIRKNRARNREHARRTRLRKKAQLEQLQEKVSHLQEEQRRLSSSLQELCTASILFGMSHPQELGDSSLVSDQVWKQASLSCKVVPQDQSIAENTSTPSSDTAPSKRKRFVSCADANEASTEKQPQILEATVNGLRITVGGPNTHINWKSGLYTDSSGQERHLSEHELKALRKERNRIHAKLTRDRKKNFVQNMQTTIDDLEASNAQMRQALDQLVAVQERSNSPYHRLPGSVTPPSYDEDEHVSSSEDEESEDDENCRPPPAIPTLTLQSMKQRFRSRATR